MSTLHGNSIQLVQPAALDEVTCENCGNSFHVDRSAASCGRSKQPAQYHRANSRLFVRSGQEASGDASIWLAMQNSMLLEN